ncbi:serine hydrolase-domain-containing protein [Boeremia exigua]|uniref:serine hydrolase-domain-containing protein n=1 Tax=Boeremia exigua TaxID=749465 RepID=UPI001E8DE11F|nr:serine hydrolase-domain-containing protein [Boeremia exigua]KAH6620322.1 serine hydrolase-domain-containing protein [Boeremia exigua]
MTSFRPTPPPPTYLPHYMRFRLPLIPLHTTPSNLLALHRLRTMAAPPPSRPIKILFLHGFTQSGPLFSAKCGALRKTLQKAFPAGITVSFPTAPLRLAPTDVSFLHSGEAKEADDEEIDAWAWWRRKGDAEPYVYAGLEEGLARVAEVLQAKGPFDGVVGFSQGGAAAAMVAALLEPGRRQSFEKLEGEGGMRYPASFVSGEEGCVHPPLKFAVSYSGFAARGLNPYHAFYEPKIKTPMLHFLGSLDTVVEESRSLALVEACEESEGRVVYHPGGHFLPSTQKASVNALIGFIKDVLHKAEGPKKEEESVEDMDMPF